MGVLPQLNTNSIYKCRVGISFALSAHIARSFRFEPSQVEDWDLLRKVSEHGHAILLSANVTYFVNGLPILNQRFYGTRLTGPAVRAEGCGGCSVCNFALLAEEIDPFGKKRQGQTKVIKKHTHQKVIKQKAKQRLGFERKQRTLATTGSKDWNTTLEALSTLEVIPVTTWSKDWNTTLEALSALEVIPVTTWSKDWNTTLEALSALR